MRLFRLSIEVILLISIFLLVVFSLANSINKIEIYATSLKNAAILTGLWFFEWFLGTVNNDKDRIPKWIEVVLHIYVYLMVVGGIIFNFYEIFENYDDIIHFLFGLNTVFLLKVVLSKGTKLFDSWGIQFFVLIFMALGFAAAWEGVEYLIDLIGNYNLQQITSMGIPLCGSEALRDTMRDIFDAFLGAMVANIVLKTIDSSLNFPMWKKAKGE